MTETSATGQRRNGHMGRLWFIGPFPPPLHGQSNFNVAMEAYLAARASLVRQPTGSGLVGNLIHTLHIVIRILFFARRGDRAYLSLPGQAGAWLFAPIVAALRLRRVPHFIHHHSFRPLNRFPSRPLQLLVALGGASQVHIVLSRRMATLLNERYLEGRRTGGVRTLSNAYLFGPLLQCERRPARAPTLGHMSVLTREKGVFYLLELFERLRRHAPEFRLVLAGPTADPELMAALEGMAARHPSHFEYRGAVSGEEKERFYRDIDIFALPTTLVDEAEPLVLLEAYGRGIDAVASLTGCIADRLRTPSHALSLDPESDCQALLQLANRGDWEQVRTACVTHARAIHEMSREEAEELFPELLHEIASPRAV
ncbi:glycosyltransferase family 4 protein [Sphingosinithalassobacter sp. LHW66-3]|uniref:glycosyltransferase family 4 protein n=1 Tax=Sphingosinithalassobacter sp. LHW66-3 TaxID=3424718 RepID=UPI003D6C6C58